MTVSNEHKEYVANKDKWLRMAVACGGHDAVQEAGEQFLPRLTDQTDSEYASYKQRSTFLNATWRTIEGLRGMIFRKESSVGVPEKIKPMLEDIDLSGTPLHVLALNTVTTALQYGRGGIWVDHPSATPGLTQADAKTLNHRPMMKLYDGFSIINWKTKVVNGKTVLSMVVLKEKINKPVDEFKDEEVIQYRVLDLEEQKTPQGVGKLVYRVRVFEVREDKGKQTDVLVAGPFYPTINALHLDYIPFQFFGTDSTSWSVGKVPLQDLAEVNFAHYRVQADYEHGCHFTGLPTPVISGYTPDGKESFCIGSMTAWVFPNASAKAAYLEFQGTGLNCLRLNLEDKKKEMAVLGARMLEAEPGAVQSAATAAIHRGGEQSMLASVANTVSYAIQTMLKIFCKFAGVDEKEVVYALNTDFFPMPMDSLMMTAVVAAWQNGAISFDIMVENLKKGEIVPMDASVEDIRKAIEASPPPVMDVPTTPGDRAGNGPNQGAAKGVNTKGASGKPPTQTQLRNGNVG